MNHQMANGEDHNDDGIDYNTGYAPIEDVDGYQGEINTQQQQHSHNPSLANRSPHRPLHLQWRHPYQIKALPVRRKRFDRQFGMRLALSSTPTARVLVLLSNPSTKEYRIICHRMICITSMPFV